MVLVICNELMCKCFKNAGSLNMFPLILEGLVAKWLLVQMLIEP